MTPFDSIPLVDNHLHPPLTARAAAALPFAGFFSEASDPSLVARHLPQTRFFRRALRDLATLLDCEPEQTAVEQARAALGADAWLRRCVTAGNVSALIVDDGFPAQAEALTVERVADVAGCISGRVLRLESLAGTLAGQFDHLPSFEAALLATLETALDAEVGGIVALKSVAAYRCGLAFEWPSRQAVEAALHNAYAQANGLPVRITNAALIYQVLATTLSWAGAVGLPVQLHSGFGDRDLYLPASNPALLRPLLEDGRLSRSPLVLLHAGYPYARSAGYLAAMYPQVYVDWSLANPLLAGPELVRVLEELLALAPATKLLYGSDAWGIPDWIWLGARYGREALAQALGDDPDAAAFAQRILHDNAAELYHLSAPALKSQRPA